MGKQTLFRLPNGTVAELEMHSIGQILKDKGLDPGGDVQMFHTQNVLRRIIKYMPNLSGMTIKTTIAQTDIHRPRIITNTPYAQYLYRGKRMVNSATGKGPGYIPGVGYRYRKGTTLKATSELLNYTKNKNPLAGPYWDRRLKAAEGKALAADVQRYIDLKGGGKK